ncbi:MAG: MMPL family transporter, partial [Actinomycetota bacterium]
MLSTLARTCFRRRRLVLAIWILAAISAGLLAGVAGGEYENDFSQPGTESQAAFDLLDERFPEHSGESGQIVFQVDGSVNDPGASQRIERFLEDASKVDTVSGVISPFQEPLGRISKDGSIAYADIMFSTGGPEVPEATIDELNRMRVEASEVDGFTVEYGGLAFAFAEQEPPGEGEIVGLIAAVVILLISFGSFIAMVLPIVTALFGIGIALALLTLSANIISVPFFAPQIATMIGIGVGIDYALFIVTRYRDALREGVSPPDAVVLALTTSGRAVVFAGLVVVVSLLGILLMGFSFVEGVAVGGASAVAMTLLASITLLPAILGFAGAKIDKITIGRKRRKDAGHGFWYRWSRTIQRRPWVPALVGLGALLALSAPLLDIRIGVADAGNGPESRTTRRAYDLVSEGFGPGFNGPLV